MTSQVPFPNLCQICFSFDGNHAVNYVLAPGLHYYSITLNQLTVTNLQNIYEQTYVQMCIYITYNIK